MKRTNAPNPFITSFKSQQQNTYEVAHSKGWFKKKNINLPEQLMLVVSELGEAMEAYRVGDPPAEKIPGFSNIEEELADVVLRCMNISEHFGYRLAQAVLAKHEYNKTRPMKHGGKKV